MRAALDKLSEAELARLLRCFAAGASDEDRVLIESLLPSTGALVVAVIASFTAYFCGPAADSWERVSMPNIARDSLVELTLACHPNAAGLREQYKRGVAKGKELSKRRNEENAAARELVQRQIPRGITDPAALGACKNRANNRVLVRSAFRALSPPTPTLGKPELVVKFDSALCGVFSLPLLTRILQAFTSCSSRSTRTRRC